MCWTNKWHWHQHRAPAGPGGKLCLVPLQIGVGEMHGNMQR